jgi:hypothetical protein
MLPSSFGLIISIQLLFREHLETLPLHIFLTQNLRLASMLHCLLVHSEHICISHNNLTWISPLLLLGTIVRDVNLATICSLNCFNFTGWWLWSKTTTSNWFEYFFIEEVEVRLLLIVSTESIAILYLAWTRLEWHHYAFDLVMTDAHVLVNFIDQAVLLLVLLYYGQSLLLLLYFLI